MPRATVTKELSETIRNIRLQNKVSSHDLAKHINKSPAYISRLENGSIQSIDTEDLYSLFRFICKEKNSIELANELYRSLTINYSQKEIDEQIWFKNFDTVECLLPIPEDLIKFFIETLKRLNISRQELLYRINSNEAIPENEKNNPKIPFNQWYSRKESKGNASSIKINLSEDTLNKILDNKTKNGPYIFVFAILFYLTKIENFGEIVSLSPKENEALMNQTTELLDKYKFYSIEEKNALISQTKSKEELLELLTSFDKTNYEIINDIISGFRAATTHNILDTNNKLDLFRENMHWDLGFMLKLTSLDYKSLENVSVSRRKEFLNDIVNLIEQYNDISIQNTIVEDY